MKNIASLEEIIQKLKEDVNGKETSVGKIVAAFERRGFGPLLLIPSLFLVLPTGAIPGAPLICSIFMILVASQILIGFKHPWIPKRLKQLTFNGKTLNKVLDKITPVVRNIDNYTGPRLTWLISPVSKWIAALVCTLLSILIIPLGAIPFAIFLPALAIVFFALGFSINDGLLIAIGIFVAGVSVIGSVFWWL